MKKLFLILVLFLSLVMESQSQHLLTLKDHEREIALSLKAEKFENFHGEKFNLLCVIAHTRMLSDFNNKSEEQIVLIDQGTKFLKNIDRVFFKKNVLTLTSTYKGKESTKTFYFDSKIGEFIEF